MIVVNFKTYSEGTGEEGVGLAGKCSEAAEATGEKVIVSPPLADLSRYQDLDLEVFSQHLDPVGTGSHTGHVNAEELLRNNVSGTLINHSEKRIPAEMIEKAVERCKKTGLTSIVCAQNVEECEELSRFKPDFIAYEPPELIGGETSVSEAKPEVVQEAVKSSKVPVLTGAGIKTIEDVEKSIELGCEGVLIASGVAKNDKPFEKVVELCRGLK